MDEPMMLRCFMLSLLVVIGSACEREVKDPGEAEHIRRSAPPSLVFGEADAGQPLRVAVGQRFGIRLSDNASIGHVWSVSDVPPFLRDEGFLYDGEAHEAAGAPTSKTFRFAPVARGRGTLRMALAYRDEPSRQLDFEIVAE